MLAIFDHFSERKGVCGNEQKKKMINNIEDILKAAYHHDRSYDPVSLQLGNVSLDPHHIAIDGRH